MSYVAGPEPGYNARVRTLADHVKAGGAPYAQVISNPRFREVVDAYRMAISDLRREIQARDAERG